MKFVLKLWENSMILSKLSSEMVFKLFRSQKLWRIVFCLFGEYSPTYIKLNLEIIASESCQAAPGGHVPNTLKFLLKSDNSL